MEIKDPFIQEWFVPDLIAIGPVQVVVRKMFFQVVNIFHLFLPILVIETDPLVYVGCV